MTQPRPYPVPETDAPVFSWTRRSDWVRLRTMVTLRWIAISGQIVTMLVGDAIFELELALGPIWLAIGAAVITNLLASFLYPHNHRLSETELVGTVLFDMVQLAVLLALTGGLNNPFAMLILAQVAIAATALRLYATVVVGITAFVSITVVAIFHLPLVTEGGETLQLPDLFVFGFWCAISIGVVFQGFYARRVTSEVTAMADALAATQMALAREQKLTDLGGVVAATAHELGTPLATIALVSGEMLEDAADRPEIVEDARLIRDQAERCRRILHSMGRIGKDDLHLRHAPIASIAEEAAEPHQDRGIAILFDLAAQNGSAAAQPQIRRRPEIIHGIRNLIQNAVDFAASTVWIDIRWTDADITVRICDDGPGYPVDLLPRLGDPFLRNRRATARVSRPGNYPGMGLGLFIAKTLLERSGAELVFANGHDPFGAAEAPRTRSGAMVTVVWPRAAVEQAEAPRAALGENLPLTGQPDGFQG